MLKAFFVSEIFTVCSDFLVTQKNGLTRKLWLILKFMTSQTGQQIITIHIVPNITISKSNPTMKLGQLIKYDMTNIFLEEPYTNMVEKLVPNPFIKNQN